MPGSLTPSGGGKFGPDVRAFEVHHPGTQPRKFVQVATDRIEKVSGDYRQDYDG